MKQTTTGLMTAVLVFVSASSASAATSVNIAASGSFTPGSLLTLETFVTANGGETDNAVGGSIIYPDALVNPDTRTQVSLGADWTQGALNCTTARCTAFSQVRAAGLIAVNVTDLLLATSRFTIDASVAPGTVLDFTWRTTPTTARLDWFGVTNAPGVSITVVPEPTTATLLGAGLLGLALARRRTHS